MYFLGWRFTFSEVSIDLFSYFFIKRRLWFFDEGVIFHFFGDSGFLLEDINPSQRFQRSPGVPRWICPIHGISVAIPIRIQPTLPKRTPTVRTVKPHQHRIKRPITIPQQITPRHRIRTFAVEAEQAEQAVFQRAMTIRCVGKRIRAYCREYVQHRALLIGGEHGGFSFTALACLLRQ
ncbi:hypothetical protein D3C73_1181430 [compost metagenome]